VCGVIGFQGGFRLQDLISAKVVLAHRGPDDSGLFEDGVHSIGLAHTRLSILDPSSLGHQPMVSGDDQVALVFNGEIYNFRELRNELEDRNYSFKGYSDSEVLLNLYLAEGESMLSRLNGIFAFALWDARRCALLIARDALGVKPLYYYAGEKGFAFSSEIKALQKLVPDLSALDFPALNRYLTYLWCPGDGTPAFNVKKLGPGEALLVSDGKVDKHISWYQLPAFHPSRLRMSKTDAVTGTVNNLRQAVHRQMVADVPVGAFLSGGLDSSSVVAFAKELNPDVRCFTIEQTGGAERGVADDLPYAQRVAEHLKVPLDVVRIDASQMAHDLEEMVVQLDEPLADPAPLNVLYISRLARDNGIKVLLSGAGGDDLFTGYRRHLAVEAERYWSWLPRSVRGSFERLSSGLDQRSTFGRRLSKLFNGATLDGDARLVNYFAWSRREDLMALYSTEFRIALSDSVAAEPMLEYLGNLPDGLSPLERMLVLEQRFFLTDHNLTYSDKMSMAVGVEVRVPFLDLDLVEFAQRIPVKFKQRSREGKWVLKKAMEPYLPHDVIYRPKSGFGAPLRRWMRCELRELLGDMLSEENLKHRGLFDPYAVQQLITENDQGKTDASYTLLSLFSIELWCRRFIDK